MANLTDVNDNVNVDGAIAEYVDFGGSDTYTILPSMSADVTITDVSGATFNLPVGLDITSASFLSNGVQFTVNGNTLTLLGDPSLFTFVFGGDPVFGGGTPLDFDATAVAFGTTVPAAGDPANDAVNTGEINDDGTVGDSGLTPEELYAEAIAEANDALADAAAAQQAADDAEAAVVDLATAEAYKAAADAAKAAADAAKAAADAAAAAAANTADAADDAEAAQAVADAEAAQATADAEVASADAAVAANQPGLTFDLTPGADDFVGPNGGTPNQDTFLGPLSQVQDGGGFTEFQTFTNDDVLDGGDGVDQLIATIRNPGTTTPEKVENIENFFLRSRDNDSAVDFVNVTGAEQVWSDRSTEDLFANNVQEQVIIGVVDGEGTEFDVNYDNGVLGPDPVQQFVLDGASDIILDVANPSGDILGAHFTVLNGDSVVEFDQTNPGAFNNDLPFIEELSIMGDGGLSIVDVFDDLLQLNNLVDLMSTTTGDVAIRTGNNLETASTADGNDMLDVRGPSIEMIETNGGEDNVLVRGPLNNDAMINMGADNDFLEIRNPNFNPAAPIMLDGGDGDMDILALDDQDVSMLSMNGDFEGSFTGFEKIQVSEVQDGDAANLNMPNLNDIHDVISEGTDIGIMGQSEVQDLDTDSPGTGTDADGFVTVSFNGNSVTVPVPASGSSSVTAFNIATALNGVLNQLPGIIAVGTDGADDVRFTFDPALGDIPVGAVTFDDPDDLVSITNQVTTPGTNQEAETFTIEVTEAGDAVDDTIQIDNILVAGGDLTVTINGGASIDDIGAAIVTAVTNAISVYTATFDPVTNLVSFTAINPGVIGDASIGDNGSGLAAGNIIDNLTVTNQGVDAVQESHSFILRIDGGDNTSGSVFDEDGFVEFGNLTIPVPAGTTVDELGALIVNNKAGIIAEQPLIADVDYDTLTGRLTVLYTEAAGNVASNTFTVPFDGDADTGQDDGVGSATVFDGVDGTMGGVLNLIDISNGGSLEFIGENDGFTDVQVMDAGLPGNSGDSFNIILNGVDALQNDGLLQVQAVETLNVTTSTTDGDPTGPGLLNLIANEAESLNVSGNHGVDLLGSGLAGLTMFDGSGVTGEGGIGDIFIDDFANDADVTATGGAGNDILNAGIVGTGTMDDVGATLSGGAGEDDLFGSGGMDILDGGDDGDEIFSSAGGDMITLGAGDDAYVMLNATHSTIAIFDIISDFVLGEDLLDFSNLLVVDGNGVEVNVFNNAADATTDLANNDFDGAFNVALDSSTGNVYADFDDDGIANSVIQLTGVTTLDDTAIFV